MDHRSLSTLWATTRVGEARKRAAMELLARHTIDKPRHRPACAGASVSRRATARGNCPGWRLPMGKCAEPTNVRGRRRAPARSATSAPLARTIESDPSFLCPNRAATPTTCAASGRRCSLRRRRLGRGQRHPASSTSSPATSTPTKGCSTGCPGEQRAMIEEALRHCAPRPPRSPGRLRAHPQTRPAVTDNYRRTASGPGAARARPSAGGHLPPCRQ